MKTKASFALGSKLLYPCRRLLRIFKLKRVKLPIRPPPPRPPLRAQPISPSNSSSRRTIPPASTVFLSLRSLGRRSKKKKYKKMDGGGRLKGSSKADRKYDNVSSTASIVSRYSGREKEKLLCTSPVSVAAAANDLSYDLMTTMMMRRRRRRRRRMKGRDSGGSGGGVYYGEEDEVEDACKSFENYLVEMIVEEGRVRDLMDVEELLYCWKKLKCPVFADLVSRFYRELCRDLFATTYTPTRMNN